MAGDRVQPLALLVAKQQHRVHVTEQIGEAVDGHLNEGVEVAAAAESGAELGEAAAGRGVGPDRTAPPCLFRQGRPLHGVLDADHPVDVGRPQAKDLLQTLDYGHRVDVVT